MRHSRKIELGCFKRATQVVQWHQVLHYDAKDEGWDDPPGKDVLDVLVRVELFPVEIASVGKGE